MMAIGTMPPSLLPPAEKPDLASVGGCVGSRHSFDRVVFVEFRIPPSGPHGVRTATFEMHIHAGP